MKWIFQGAVPLPLKWCLVIAILVSSVAANAEEGSYRIMIDVPPVSEVGERDDELGERSFLKYGYLEASLVEVSTKKP